jgi:hypothetical protein
MKLTANSEAQWESSSGGRQREGKAKEGHLANDQEEQEN